MGEGVSVKVAEFVAIGAIQTELLQAPGDLQAGPDVQHALLRSPQDTS
jgi:hypothetical protein